jgi:hypothetical protein
MNYRQSPEALQQLLRITRDIDLKIGDGFRRFLFDDFDAQDVALLACDLAGLLVQLAGAGFGALFFPDSLGQS